MKILIVRVIPIVLICTVTALLIISSLRLHQMKEENDNLTRELRALKKSDIELTQENLLERYNDLIAKAEEFKHADSSSGYLQAWEHSYLLDAHFQMYTQTNDLDELRHLVDDVSRAINATNAPDDPNKIGWDVRLPSFVPEKLGDPSFDKDLLEFVTQSKTNWSITHGSCIKDINMDVGVTIRGSDEAANGIRIFFDTYTPDKTYGLNFDAKSLNSKIKVFIKNESSGEIIQTAEFEGLTWQTYEIRFKTPVVKNSLLSVNFEIIGQENSIIRLKDASCSMVVQYLVHDMMILTPVVKFIQEVHKDYNLGSEKYDGAVTFKEIADILLTFVIKTVSKWECNWSEEYSAYRFPDEIYMEKAFGFQYKVLPHNYNLQACNVLLPLCEITGNQNYRERASKILSYVKSTLILKTAGNDGEYYIWNYYNKISNDDETNPSTANALEYGPLMVRAMFMAYEYETVFDEQDMRRLVNTFINVFWNKDVENPLIFSRGYVLDELFFINNVREWLLLAKFEPRIAQVSKTIVEKNFYEPMNPFGSAATYAFLYQYLSN